MQSSRLFQNYDINGESLNVMVHVCIEGSVFVG